MELPARIGRYEVVRLLGQGGMGRVLLAEDPVLGRQVAVKLLRDDLGLPPESRLALQRRMRQEARAAAVIGHPHLVELHDMGEEEPYGLYLVFEFVDGPTLRDRIGQGQVDLADVARIARELGDALTCAHEAGVVHRDVKPENVILSRFGAKLTDFGLARLPDSTLTAAGSVLGTPAYSAPEALARAEFGPESDQFSLGATLYEAIAGKRAFPGDDALTIATRIATEPVPALPFTAADPRLVARLDVILGRAMSRTPADRYPSCRAFGDALANAIEARVIEVDSLPPKSIVPRSTRRAQNMFAAVALLVIVVLLVVGRKQDGEQRASLKAVASAFASAATATAPHASAKNHGHRPPVPAVDAGGTPQVVPSSEPAKSSDAGAPAESDDDASP